MREGLAWRADPLQRGEHKAGDPQAQSIRARQHQVVDLSGVTEHGMDSYKTRLVGTKFVIVRIVAIISVVEFLIMLTLEYLPSGVGRYGEAIIDIALLSLLSSPLIYAWVVRPFVEERDVALAQWSRLAFTDPLTQLGNRRLLLDHLQKSISSSVRHKVHAALLLLDLDGFKPVNDACGHEAGDIVLIEIAKRLQAFTRSEDVAARLGGDEFVVLIDRVDADPQQAQEKILRIARKLIDVISRPVVFNGQSLTVGASIGVRLIGGESIDPETAIAQADIALYEAKKAGRGGTVFFQDFRE